MANEQEIRHLRHRFIEDTNAPIAVHHSPYFEDRLRLFEKDFGTQTAYNNYVDYVIKNYEGNVNKFLEEYHTIREEIIASVSNSEAYKEFNSNSVIDGEIKACKPAKGNVNVYICDNAVEGNNCFLSIDMRKANFQTLKYINPAIVRDAETYEGFIRKFTDFEFAVSSKRTRQIIFGKLNPSRTMAYEKVLMNYLEIMLRKTPIYEYFDLYSFNSDELIYKLKKDVDFGAAIKAVTKEVDETVIKLNTTFDFRMEFFNLNVYQFNTGFSSKSINVFTKDNVNGKREYKCASDIYFPQTYKLINGIVITDNDLVFYYDKCEMAKFIKPLELIKK